MKIYLVGYQFIPTSLGCPKRDLELGVETYVVAAEECVRLIADRNCFPIPTLRKVKLWILSRVLRGTIEDTASSKLLPVALFQAHEALMHESIVVQLSGTLRIFGDLLGDGGRRKAENGCQIHLDCND